MYDDSKETVEIEARITHQTVGAIRIKAEGPAGAVEEWIPRSLCTNTQVHADVDGLGICVTIPHWLARAKGLI